MRGLSADERAMLSAMSDSGGSGFEWDAGDPDESRWDCAHASLVERGCASMSVQPSERGDDWEVEVYDITDLGRLALHVAALVEALS